MRASYRGGRWKEAVARLSRSRSDASRRLPTVPRRGSRLLARYRRDPRAPQCRGHVATAGRRRGELGDLVLSNARTNAINARWRELIPRHLGGGTTVTPSLGEL